MIDGRVKHGLGGRYNRAPEFNTWCKMRQRCDSPTTPDFANYGGRGIKVCARWYEFAAFLEDMGARPSTSHSIERVDNDRGYSPDNCVWATRIVQARNRRPRKVADECSRGHPLAGENLYSRASGKRGCRECRRLNMTAFYARKKEQAHA